MDHKAVIVSVNVGGRIRLKLNGDISHGRVDLETRPRAAVLTQDVGCEVITIVKGQQVVLAHVEPGTYKPKKKWLHFLLMI